MLRARLANTFNTLSTLQPHSQGWYFTFSLGIQTNSSDQVCFGIISIIDQTILALQSSPKTKTENRDEPLIQKYVQLVPKYPHRSEQQVRVRTGVAQHFGTSQIL